MFFSCCEITTCNACIFAHINSIMIYCYYYAGVLQCHKRQPIRRLCFSPESTFTSPNRTKTHGQVRNIGRHDWTVNIWKIVNAIQKILNTNATQRVNANILCILCWVLVSVRIRGCSIRSKSYAAPEVTCTFFVRSNVVLARSNVMAITFERVTQERDMFCIRTCSYHIGK